MILYWDWHKITIKAIIIDIEKLIFPIIHIISIRVVKQYFIKNTRKE